MSPSPATANHSVAADLPKIPAALLSRPRRIRAKRLGMGLWFIRLFILPHTIVGLGALGAVVGFPIWYAFGTIHVAQVTATRTYSSHGKNGTTHHFEVTYTYNLEGHPRIGTADVDEQAFNEINGGRQPMIEKPKYGTVTMRGLGIPPLYYDAPVRSSGSFWPTWGFLVLWASFWNGVLSVFWWMLWIRPWQVRRLYRNGRVGFGVVRDKREKSGKSTTYYIKYEFRTEDGLHDVRENTVEAAEYHRATIGENVVVLHRDGKTKPSVLYEYGGYTCVP